MLTPAIMGSLRIPASAAPSAPALANALAGQTIEATLEAVLPDGLVLRLADGKQLQAQGSLPFPPGSTLGLRGVPLPEGAGIRLQVVRATPPPSPALLAPLAFGEAAPLLARLQSSAAQTPLGQMLGQLLQAGLAVAEQPEVWSAWPRRVRAGSRSPCPGRRAPNPCGSGSKGKEPPLEWMRTRSIACS